MVEQADNRNAWIDDKGSELAKARDLAAVRNSDDDRRRSVFLIGHLTDPIATPLVKQADHRFGAIEVQLVEELLVDILHPAHVAGPVLELFPPLPFEIRDPDLPSVRFELMG